MATNITVSQSLATSYVSGATITATDAGANVTISVSAHNRYYPQANGSVSYVTVNAGSVTGLAYSTQYFIFYDDPARTGGTVTYQQTNNAVYAAQLGELHVVGAVTTPAALGAPIGGSYTRPPGSGAISNL